MKQLRLQHTEIFFHTDVCGFDTLLQVSCLYISRKFFYIHIY